MTGFGSRGLVHHALFADYRLLMMMNQSYQCSFDRNRSNIVVAMLTLVMMMVVMIVMVIVMVIIMFVMVMLVMIMIMMVKIMMMIVFDDDDDDDDDDAYASFSDCLYKYQYISSTVPYA